MLYQFLFILLGTLSIICAIRFCSDFSASKNPLFQGIKREAKIIGFCTSCTWRTVEEFAVIEYLEEGRVIKSKVERANEDSVGDEIAVLSGEEGFAVRCSPYVPFDTKYKMLCVIQTFSIFIAHSIAYEESNMAGWLLLSLIGICCFLWHPFWLYRTFYEKRKKRHEIENKTCVLIRKLAPVMLWMIYFTFFSIGYADYTEYNQHREEYIVVNGTIEYFDWERTNSRGGGINYSIIQIDYNGSLHMVKVRRRLNDRTGRIVQIAIDPSKCNEKMQGGVWTTYFLPYNSILVLCIMVLGVVLCALKLSGEGKVFR